MAVDTSSISSPKTAMEATEAARRQIVRLLQERRPDPCPLFLHLAFLDAGTYDPASRYDSGASASIRVQGIPNTELQDALNELDKIKDTTSGMSYLSYADLYQLAGIEAVKKAGGPDNIDFKHGRKTSCIPPPNIKFLPLVKGDDATYVRHLFNPMGFNDKEIVALSSACCYWENSSQFKDSAQKIDKSFYKKLVELYKEKAKEKKQDAPPTTSAKVQKSETSEVATFHYWNCLLNDPSFRKHVEDFAESPNDPFRQQYAEAHRKLSELGFKHFPEPHTDYHDLKPSIAFAVAMTILVGFIGFIYEVMKT